MNKFFQASILNIIAWLLLCQAIKAQDSDPSWRFVFRQPSPAELAPIGDAPTETANPPVGNGIQAITALAADDESTHPQIVALARGLRHDPVRIFNYVFNYIQYDHYYGARRGAVLTLLQRIGNDYDQCALLGALLRASGYTPTLVRAKQFWTFEMFERWYGLQDPFQTKTWTQAYQSWGYTTDPYGGSLASETAKKEIFSMSLLTVIRGWPEGSFSPYSTGIAMERVWLRLTLGGQVYELDPTLKNQGSTYGPDLSGLGYSRTAFRTAGGGQTAGTYSVKGINETALGAYVQACADRLVESERASIRPHKLLSEILGDSSEVLNPKSLDEALPTGLAYYPNYSGRVIIDGAVSSVPAVDASLKSRIKLDIAGASTPLELVVSELAGRRLALVFSGDTASILLEDDVLMSVNVPASTLAITTTILNPANFEQEAKTTNYAKGNNSVYAFVYSVPGNNQLLNWRQKKLEEIMAKVETAGGYSTDAAGSIIFNTIPDTALRRKAVAESLYVLGLQWSHERHLAANMVAAAANVQSHSVYFFGRVGQEQKANGSDGGYYVDFFMHGLSPFARTAEYVATRESLHVQGIFDSALEHSVVERSQSVASAVSTVRVMQLANRAVTDQNRDQLFLFTYANRATVKPLLKGYSAAFLATMEEDARVTGRVYFLPENAVTSTQQWTGLGYAAFGQEILMNISGGLAGGFGTTLQPLNSLFFTDVFTQPGFDLQGGLSTSFRVDSPTFNVFSFLSIDPVDMGTGAFVLDSEDLSLGEGGTRGLSFRRSYNSHRRESNPVGLGWGWTHNYDMRATVRSAPEAVLGNGTLPQAALFIAAAHACVDLYSARADARDYGIVFMTAGWLVDQIRGRAVSITLGNESLQFVQRPDGNFIPPAKSTLTLTKEANGDYLLKERLGATYRFAATQDGRCTTVTDIDGRVLTLGYTGGKLTSVTDHVGRRLTLGYAGDRLSTVTDNATPARLIQFTPDAQGNLAAYTDPENKTWHYGYGATDVERSTHQIRETRDPDDRIIVTNVYDSEGRVTSQKNQGLADREFTFYWSGYENSEVNPKNEETIYFYDVRNRPVGKSDGIKYNAAGGVVSATGQRLADKIRYMGEDLVDSTLDTRKNYTYFTYDRHFNLKEVRKGVSRYVYTKYYYDSVHRVERVEEIDSLYPNPSVSDGLTVDRVTRFEYLPGNLTSRPDAVVDGRNVRTEFTYYPAGTAFVGKPHKKIVKSTEGDRETIYTYDVRGLPESVATPKRGGGTEVESYVFNYVGDLVSRTDRRNVTTTTDYNKRRQAYKLTGPGDLPDYASAVTRMVYDSAGNLSYTVDAEGRAVHTTYTPTSQRHVVSTGLFNGDLDAPGLVAPDIIATATYGFDIRDIRTTVTGALPEQTTTYSIDGARRAYEVLDPEGHKTTTFYSARDEPVERRQPLTATTSKIYKTNYNFLGHANVETDPRKSSSIDYAAWGDLLAFTTLGKKYSFTYFPNGLPKETITPLLRKTSLDYNDRNLLKSKTEPSMQVTTLVYDVADRVETATDALGTISYAYDGNGQPLTVTEGAVTVTRVYDPYGHVKSFSDSSLGTVEYRYYANGNLKKLIYPGTPAFNVTYEYDAHNRLSKVTDSSNRVTSLKYRADGLLELITLPNQATSMRTYDLAGHLLTIEEKTPSGAVHSFQRYGYDLAFRLTNRLVLPKSPATFAEPLAAMTYDNDNRLLTWAGQNVEHDLDGNMTTGPLPDGTLGAFTFNARNQLTAAGGWSYTYDPEGRRVSASSASETIQYIWDPHGSPLPRVVARQNAGGDTVCIVYAGNLPLYEVNVAAGILHYFHFDVGGNTVAISNAAGLVTDRIDYSPYGTVNRRTGTTDTPFLFGGGGGVLTDPNGLVYMRARYYNPRIGRFINQDPIGFEGGPNWFVYANSNPVMFSDPSGNYSMAYANGLAASYAKYGANMRIPGFPSSATELLAAGEQLASADLALAGRSLIGMGANGVAMAVGAGTSSVAVGAPIAIWGSYGFGAHAGNFINAFTGTEAQPSGLAETAFHYGAPGNVHLKQAGMLIDTAVPFAAGLGGLNAWQSATAVGWRLGGSASQAGTTTASMIAYAAYGVLTADAAAQIWSVSSMFSSSFTSPANSNRGVDASVNFSRK